MTDEIRITRRVALATKYEFYELEIKMADPKPSHLDDWIDHFEKKVLKIREELGKPTPEISTKAVKHPPFEPEQQGEFTESISRLSVDDEHGDLCAVKVKRLGKVSMGRKKDGNMWTRQDMTVTDGNSDIMVVAWDEDTLEEVREGDVVDVLDYVKIVQYMGDLQVKLGSKSRVVVA